MADLPTFDARLVSESDGSSASSCQVIRVTGEIDYTTSAELRQTISTAIVGGARQVLVDLAETEFIDASGIGVLVGASELARDAGSQLVIRQPSRPVLRLLELLQLRDELIIWDGRSDARN